MRRFSRGTNSFISTFPEDVLRGWADAADEQRKSDREWNANKKPLLGIPLAVKDNTYVAGIACTGGSRVLGSFMPTRDADAVARLRGAGAIIVGKTNLHEFARGSTNMNPHFGTTPNPWRPDRVSGGSSGGSAVAISWGFCSAATGTDTGGSIRGPAALCGVVGLKPTYDSVSRDGVIPLSWSLDHVGPMTRTVEDCRILYSVMAIGGCAERKEPDDLKGIRLGVPVDLVRAATPEVASEFYKALDRFREAGAAILDTVAIPHLDHVRPAVLTITFAEGTSVHDRWFRKSPELYGEDVRSSIEIGYSIPATRYLKALRFRGAFVRGIDRVFGQADVLALPTVPLVAPKIGEESVELAEGRVAKVGTAMATFTSMFNLSGNPAISVPTGTVGGLPVGVQLIAEHDEEDRLFRVGTAFENVSGSKNLRPPVPS